MFKATVGDVDFGKGPTWDELPATKREMEDVRSRFLRAFPRAEVTAYSRSKASRDAVRSALSRVDIAHLATHGFFDEQALSVERKRSTEQLVNWQYAAGQTTERIGVGSRSPLGYVGLVLAGANSPEAIRKHSGIISGEAIVDLPLEGLRLCVLSACETGLGEYTSGEGVQGLQRAFHLAGCPNVVASLWKVGDVSTAVLMEEFYKRLWDKEKPLSPIEALREAQLTILRNPDLVLKRHEAMVAELKKQGFSEKEIASRGFKSDLVALPEGGKVGVLKRSPTQWWAAFALSGVGK